MDEEDEGCCFGDHFGGSGGGDGGRIACRNESLEGRGKRFFVKGDGYQGCSGVGNYRT